MNFNRDVELVIDGQRFGYAGVQPVRAASGRVSYATALVGRCADCGKPFAQSVRGSSLVTATVARRCAAHRKNGVRVATICVSARRQPPAFTAAMAAVLSQDVAPDEGRAAPPKPRSPYKQLSASDMLGSDPAEIIVGRSSMMQRDISAKDLIELLQHGWMPKPAIGNAIGISKSTVVRMLRRAVQFGLIERDAHQTYRLTAAWSAQRGGKPRSADGQGADGMGPPARQTL